MKKIIILGVFLAILGISISEKSIISFKTRSCENLAFSSDSLFKKNELIKCKIFKIYRFDHY